MLPIPSNFTDAQRAAVKTALESRISIICGPPGVGKTSVLASLVEHGGDQVLITALAAAAVQRAREITGGRATTVASLTTNLPRWGDFRLTARPDRLRGIDTLIIDEASMIGSRQMATLLDGCDEARVARVVFAATPTNSRRSKAARPSPICFGRASFRRHGSCRYFVRRPALRFKILLRPCAVASLRPCSPNPGRNFPTSVRALNFCLATSQCRRNRAKYRELAGVFGEPDIAVLSPFKSDDFGVHALNAQLRAALGFDTEVPRVGEIVMCIENAPSGDTGFDC